MAEKIIKHHYSEFRLERLKSMYNKLGFQVYAEQNKMLPVVDKVKRGNATEIILSEYIESCLGKDLIKVFKFGGGLNRDGALVMLVDANFDSCRVHG